MNKKVKTVDEAVKEVVEGKKQNIELQVEKYEMEGPTFHTLFKHEDIAGYSVNDQFVAIMDKEGATFIYMVKNFDRIYHYNV